MSVQTLLLPIYVLSLLTATTAPVFGTENNPALKIFGAEYNHDLKIQSVLPKDTPPQARDGVRDAVEVDYHLWFDGYKAKVKREERIKQAIAAKTKETNDKAEREKSCCRILSINWLIDYCISLQHEREAELDRKFSGSSAANDNDLHSPNAIKIGGYFFLKQESKFPGVDKWKTTAEKYDRLYIGTEDGVPAAQNQYLIIQKGVHYTRGSGVDNVCAFLMEDYTIDCGPRDYLSRYGLPPAKDFPLYDGMNP